MEEINFAEGEIEWNPSDNQKFQSPSESYSPPTNSSNFNLKSKRIFEAPSDAVKKIYTDGGSRILNTEIGKRYVGAWSFYVTEDDELHGKAEDNSTNNQMELMAAIRALEWLDQYGVPKDSWVIIVTDSDYVRLGILFWTKKWAKNNWVKINQEGKPEEIKNLDLWKRLYELNQSRKVYWDKVKGHSGEEGNEKVDVNCGLLMDEFIKTAGIKILKK